MTLVNSVVKYWDASASLNVAMEIFLHIMLTIKTNASEKRTIAQTPRGEGPRMVKSNF
jgi:hypothetical protein